MLLTFDFNGTTFRARDTGCCNNCDERIAVVSTRVFRRVIDAPGIESRTALEDVMRHGFLTTDRHGQSFRVMSVEAAYAGGFASPDVPDA